MTIKKTIHPKHRMPVLNWTALKPNQVKGTVFSELDDEKLYDVSCHVAMIESPYTDSFMMEINATELTHKPMLKRQLYNQGSSVIIDILLIELLILLLSYL